MEYSHGFIYSSDSSSVRKRRHFIASIHTFDIEMAFGSPQTRPTTTKIVNKLALDRNSLRRPKSDLYRLATFRQWRSNTNMRISAAVLAKVGFSYTGESDRVRCETCKLEIDRWMPGMDPKEEHMTRSPQCPFVKDQTELFSKNGIFISSTYPLRSH